MKIRMLGPSFIVIAILLAVGCRATHENSAAETDSSDLITEPYDLDTDLLSRSISFENPTGAPGEGGKASSTLGVGRKGAPVRRVEPGETVQLADIVGPGTIRHIWMTTFDQTIFLRGGVIRIYWDGQEHPSIEAPIGDFFGFAHGQTRAFQSAVHSVGDRYGMNIWMPMPFVKNARVTFTNETPQWMPVFFQIDYTLNDRHPEDVGRLHVLFRRDNPTTAGEDFELLPERKGKGRFMGVVIGVRPDRAEWWGEGELKVYMDGDDAFPTIAGTGSEDYVGLSWGIQQNAHLYHGASWREKDDTSRTGRVSMYRWHLPDPIFWRETIRVTIQQIGHTGRPAANLEEYTSEFFEREDDWSTATFWYEPLPSAPLPVMPDFKARTVDLISEE